jgi:DNA helicase II / ATP-dependent DNA helicase PcrA
VREEIGTDGLDASAAALDGWSHGAVASHTDDLDALDALAHLEERPDRFGSWLGDALAVGDDEHGVTLASIHAVKGQEWPHVVLLNVSAGLLPHRLVDDEEEERRVLHVGLTRGRSTVTVVPGPQPSPFLAELAAPGVPPPKREVVRSASAPTAKPPPEQADDMEAFERLREWRRRRADGKPAYTVLPDATLRVLADSKPTTERELSMVAGIGPTKLQNYGEELLALLAELRSGADEA